MKNDHLLRKVLILFIILLFSGGSLISNITFPFAKASNTNDFIEVTTQACDVKNTYSTTVKLTYEQYQSLMQYLTDFRARLNKTSTREEAAFVFKEVVVELNTFGLLPKGMTIDLAQQLVVGRFQNPKLRLQRNTLFKDSYDNYLCLIAGQTNHTLFENVGSVLFNTIQFSTSMTVFSFLSGLMYRFITLRCSNNPFSMLSRMNLGYQNTTSNVTIYASGWVSTTGSLGIKRNEGNIRGMLPIEGTQYSTETPTTYTQHPAVVGFIGLKLGSGSMFPNIYEGKEFFYVGTALWTSIASDL